MKTYKQLLERINMAKAKMGDVIKDFQDSDAPQFKGKSQEKRRQMAIAAKMAAEEVELEEGRMKEIAMDMETLGDKEFKAKHKKSKQDMQSALKSEELKGDQHKIDANKNGKIDGHDFKLLRSKKKVEEEVEEIDEVSRGLLSRYQAASKAEGRKNRLSPSGASSKVTKRTQGADLAMRKSLSAVTGKKLARVPATNEEVEQIDEISAGLARKAADKAYDLGAAERRKTRGNDASPLEKKRNIQGRNFDRYANKKEMANEEVEQIEESDLKPFIVVHAKHGKFETHAASTYEAAKNAAAHWKTKKGTAGMDVHRADITHSTQHVG